MSAATPGTDAVPTSKAFEPVTVSGSEEVRVTVGNVAQMSPFVALYVGRDLDRGAVTGLEPQDAFNLAIEILRAAEFVGSPVAKYVLDHFHLALNVDKDWDVVTFLTDDEIAAGAKLLADQMKAAGAATVDELYAMNWGAANKANADGAQ